MQKANQKSCLLEGFLQQLGQFFPPFADTQTYSLVLPDFFSVILCDLRFIF